MTIQVIYRAFYRDGTIHRKFRSFLGILVFLINLGPYFCFNVTNYSLIIRVITAFIPEKLNLLQIASFASQKELNDCFY